MVLVFIEYSVLIFLDSISNIIKVIAEDSSRKFPNRFADSPLSKIGSAIVKMTPKRPIKPPTKNFLDILSFKKSFENRRESIGIDDAIIAALIAPVSVIPV